MRWKSVHAGERNVVEGRKWNNENVWSSRIVKICGICELSTANAMNFQWIYKSYPHTISTTTEKERKRVEPPRQAVECWALESWKKNVRAITDRRMKTNRKIFEPDNWVVSFVCLVPGYNVVEAKSYIFLESGVGERRAENMIKCSVLCKQIKTECNFMPHCTIIIIFLPFFFSLFLCCFRFVLQNLHTEIVHVFSSTFLSLLCANPGLLALVSPLVCLGSSVIWLNLESSQFRLCVQFPCVDMRTCWRRELSTFKTESAQNSPIFFQMLTILSRKREREKRMVERANWRRVEKWFSNKKAKNSHYEDKLPPALGSTDNISRDSNSVSRRRLDSRRHFSPLILVCYLSNLLLFYIFEKFIDVRGWRGPENTHTHDEYRTFPFCWKEEKKRGKHFEKCLKNLCQYNFGRVESLKRWAALVCVFGVKFGAFEARPKMFFFLCCF